MTHKQKRIDNLLDLQMILNNSIINEIREVNRGKGHTAKEIEETLKFWIEERIPFMMGDDNLND